MYNFTLSCRQVALSLLVAVSAIGSGAAQSQMQARTLVSSAMAASPELATDELIATASTITPTPITLTNLLGQAGSVRVKFPTAVQKDQQGKVILKMSSSTATILGGVVLKTYLSTSPTPDNPIQSISLNSSGLATVDITGSDPDAKMMQFTATAPFDQIQLDAAALANTNYSVSMYAAFGTVAPLPVELTAFTGKATPAGVALQWATASERNADYFEVQRTENALDDFRSLGQVKCAGSSSQARTYQFVDAASTGLHYYRLRQVDANGKASFSPVVAVEGGALATVLTAYPTLASQELTITGPAGMHLGVFNQQGQQVQLADIAASQTQQLDVRGLPGGLYFLRDAATGQSTRFIKTGAER